MSQSALKTVSIDPIAEPIAALADSAHAATVRDGLARNVGFDFAARVGYLVSRVFIPPFVLARIGISAYGLWSTVFILVSYVGMSTFGINAVYVKYVAEFSARGDYRKANSLLSTGLATSSTLCLAIFAAVMLAWPHLMLWLNVPRNLHREAREVVLMVVAIFLCDMTFSVFSDALSGAQKIAEVQIIWVIAYLVEAACIFYLVGTGHGIVGMAEAFMIRTVLSIALSVVVAFRMLPWLRISPRLFSRRSISTLVNFGGVVQLGAVISIALSTVERVIGAPLIGLSAVAVLDISDKLPTMACSIPLGFASAFLPAASYLQGGLENVSSGHDTIVKLYLRGARYMNLTASSMTGFMAVTSGPLLAVWIGKLYPGTAYLMAIFAVQQHLHMMTGPGTSILKGLGRPREEFLYSVPNLLLLAVTIPLSRIVLGHWSAVGLGSAVVVATSIAAIGFIIHANRLLAVPPRRYLKYVVMPSLLPYLVGGCFAIPAWMFVPHLTRLQGAALIAVIGTLYAITLALIVDRGVFEPQERLWFHQNIRGGLRRFLPAFWIGDLS